QPTRTGNVIAEDGTVLQPFVEDRYRGLPLVVGSGAGRRAKDFIGLLDRYPEIRSALSASVLVAERRWNLRLTNGMDVRLPENDLQAALDRLVKLDHDKKLLSRDIASIDLRLPDRVTVRLSDAATQARGEALKGRKKEGEEVGIRWVRAEHGSGRRSRRAVASWSPRSTSAGAKSFA